MYSTVIEIKNDVAGDVLNLLVAKMIMVVWKSDCLT